MKIEAGESTWASAARRAGMEADGTLNAAAIPLGFRRPLVWRRADGTTLSLSAAELQRRAGDLAAALAALGVQRGDRVGGMLGRRPDAFALPLAVWRLGAIYVPLFSGFGRDAVAVRLVDSGARALLVDGANAATAVAVREQLPELLTVAVEEVPDSVDTSVERVLERGPMQPDLCRTSAHDVATLMYTSGTTGAPKGCMVPHYGVVTLWPFVEHCLDLGPNAVLFSTADSGWSFGLYTTGFAPMSLGVTRVLHEGGFDAAGWWTTARETGAQHMASAPTGYRQLAAAGLDASGDPLPELTGATSCGEPLTPEVVAWFDRHLGVAIHDSYGLTELGILIAQLRGPGSEAPAEGSMGQALPGFELRLLGDGMEEVAEGESGRVAVRDHGWLLSRGYWNRAEEWQSRLRDGWWVTEDLVRREGDRYWYVGRADDVIVTAGYNVGPGDVERVILEHPLVADAACVGAPDERKGQVVAAHVVLHEGGALVPDGLLEDLRRSVGERLGWHAAPRLLHVLPSLPRTESGKVRRCDLRRGDGR